MKHIKFLWIIIGIAITIGFSTCKKDSFDFSKITPNMNWDPSYAVPLAYGNLDMRDLMRDYDTLHLFQWDQTGLLYLMYYSHIGQFNSADKFYLPTQTTSESINSTEMNLTGFNTPGATAQFSKTQNITLTIVPAGSEIDSINLKSATLVLGVSSTFLHTGVVTVIFPSITKNGLPYQKQVNINSATGTFNISSVYNDLNGYKMNLTTTGSYNVIPVQFQLSLTNSGAAQTSGAVSFNVSFNSIKYVSMFGFFGNQQIIFNNDSIDLKMFSDAFQGGYYFEDPRFNVNVKNSYGIPIKFYFTNLMSYRTIAPAQTTLITGSGVPYMLNPKTLNYPNLYTQFGQTMIDSISLNKNNSNIASAIGTSPHYFIFGAIAEVNPIHQHNNFITENSFISADLEVTLPLWGWAQGLALQDTEALDFSKYYHDYQGRMLKRAMIRISSENGFPIDINMQISFATYDSLTQIYTIKDRLIDGDSLIVPSGITNADGRVISSTSKIKDVVIEQAKLKKMYEDKITHILFKAVLNTHNSPTHSVKFYDDYKIKVHTGIQCDFDANTLTIQNFE